MQVNDFSFYNDYKYKVYVDIRWGSSGSGRRTAVGLSKNVIFIVFLLAIYVRKLSSGYAGYIIQDREPFDGFSVVPKFMTLNEPE